MASIKYDKHIGDSKAAAISLMDYLDSHGIRLTEQRRRICEVLAIAQAQGHHPTAEEINAYAIGQDKSNSTTYRTLNILIEAGLVDVLDFRDGRIRYEIRPNAPHGHLVNQYNGTVKEFEINRELATQLAQVNDSGLPLHEIHIVLHVGKERGDNLKKQRV